MRRCPHKLPKLVNVPLAVILIAIGEEIEHDCSGQCILMMVLKGKRMNNHPQFIQREAYENSLVMSQLG